MAKVSISIPDELKEHLDQFVADTGQNRSEAVANILAAFFEEYSRPEQSTQLDDLAVQLAQVKAYLENLHDLDPDSRPRPEWVDEPEVRAGFFASSWKKRSS